jgi:nucleotide-binding universal stress UspA family protein
MIVVGVDGSESSIDALRWAATQARLTGASLEAVMAWEWPTAWGRTPTWPPGWDPDVETRKQLAGAVEKALGPRSTVDVHQVVVEGHAASVLVDAAIHADLLVVGHRGSGTFVGTMLGSVSQRCLTHAPCPVTVVRQHE